MSDTIRTVGQGDENFPEQLRNIHDPPTFLYIRGGDLRDILGRPCVAIVGSRKVTSYGKEIATKLASELAREGVTIVSGLAIGVDGIAHRAALEAGGTCVAVLPSGLDAIYPASHRELAERILRAGGALVSEYPPRTIAYKLNFIARNRIVSALSSVVVIPEAAEKSGTLHTARFALEQGKEVMAVPGNITSVMSVGANNLIKTGAGGVTSAADVLHVLGIETKHDKNMRPPKGANAEEQLILGFVAAGTHDGAELLAATGLSTEIFNQTLTMLEISGAIRALGANRWMLR
ncbi:MAG TPA: DNA-processing protein DprA [Candidatus Saccharimonadales bacterium]